VPVLLILLPGVVLYSPVAVTTWYFNAHLRRPALNLAVASFSAICGAAFIWMLAPSRGLVGVAVASAGAYAAASAFNLVILQRSSGLSFAQLLDAARHSPRRATASPGAPAE
jgi:O-antigen/teichoic acid export membrane protein